MPITLPRIDDRRYDDLVAEALGRASVHTPEWTNLNRSDPGVTLIEVFAFLGVGLEQHFIGLADAWGRAQEQLQPSAPFLRHEAKQRVW